MRNLAQFPLSQIEIATILREQAEDLRGQNKIGDLRPLALEQAAKMVEAAAKLVDGIQVIP